MSHHKNSTHTKKTNKKKRELKATTKKQKNKIYANCFTSIQKDSIFKNRYAIRIEAHEFCVMKLKCISSKVESCNTFAQMVKKRESGIIHGV